jgi:cytochrome oxidase Cu insertion factor (SCO1/SenC/PrrC family)
MNHHALAMTGLLLLGACGRGSESATTPTATATPKPETATTAPVPPEVAASADAPFVHRSAIIDPKPAPDFTLTDQQGKPFTHSSTDGKVRLVGFVYSH